MPSQVSAKRGSAATRPSQTTVWSKVPSDSWRLSGYRRARSMRFGVTACCLFRNQPQHRAGIEIPWRQYRHGGCWPVFREGAQLLRACHQCRNIFKTGLSASRHMVEDVVVGVVVGEYPRHPGTLTEFEAWLPTGRAASVWPIVADQIILLARVARASSHVPSRNRPPQPFTR